MSLNAFSSISTLLLGCMLTPRLVDFQADRTQAEAVPLDRFHSLRVWRLFRLANPLYVAAKRILHLQHEMEQLQRIGALHHE